MSHWAAQSVSLILALHILKGKIILEFEETHIYYQCGLEIC